MNQEFFVLDTNDGPTRKLFAGGQYQNTYESCPACGAYQQGDITANVHEIKLDHIGKLGFAVYLWNSHSLPIFRKDLVDLWEDKGFSGYITEPVNIIDWNNNKEKYIRGDLPEYRLIKPISMVRLSTPSPVEGPCSNCGFVKYDFPVIGSQLMNGISIQQSSWEGADINGVKYYNLVICTRRVVETTLEAGFGKFISFVRAENWQKWENFDIEKWSPKEYEKYVDSFLIKTRKGL